MERQAARVAVTGEEKRAREIGVILEEWGFEVEVIADEDPSADLSRRSVDVLVIDTASEGEVYEIGTASELARDWAVPAVVIADCVDREALGRLAAAQPAGVILRPFTPRQLWGVVTMALQQRTPRVGDSSRLRRIEQGLQSIASILRDLGVDRQAQLTARIEQSRLSRREEQIVFYLAQGARLPSIAKKLGVSVHTVRNQLRGVFRKLGVHSQDELASWLQDAHRTPAPSPVSTTRPVLEGLSDGQ